MQPPRPLPIPRLSALVVALAALGLACAGGLHGGHHGTEHEAHTRREGIEAKSTPRRDQPVLRRAELTGIGVPRGRQHDERPAHLQQVAVGLGEHRRDRVHGAGRRFVGHEVAHQLGSQEASS